MKKVVKKHYKVIIGIIVGLIVSTMGTYAAEQVLTGDEVLYTNSTSGNKTVQAAIDDLYKKVNGELDTEYKEEILNGADPVLGENMIPVTIDDDGKVTYASKKSKWYSYKTKKWANAVILSSGNYKVGDTIPESSIQSYFVWIPRYSYKIWDDGNYTEAITIDLLKDTEEAAKNGDSTSLRFITGNARLIDIQFGANKNDSGTTVGSYHTNEAFTTFETKGLWVGKFEITGDINKVTVKPEQVSVRKQTVGQFWNALYNYNRKLDSHMMKNTEWGAVAYLSHSIYGKGSKVNINNNSDFKTGYSATANTDQSGYPGVVGTASGATQPWNTTTGYQASTTGNITGIYDMGGGAGDVMASYREGQNSITSGITDEELSKYNKYFDKYPENISMTSYNNRKLGDATGELGPFYCYYDSDGRGRYYHSSWYSNDAYIIGVDRNWFCRGGLYRYGKLAGQFDFYTTNGEASNENTARLVLAIR